jgi:hypothetical protein
VPEGSFGTNFPDRIQSGCSRGSFNVVFASIAGSVFFLKCRLGAVEGLRNEPLTLEKEFFPDRDSFLIDGCFFCDEEELVIDSDPSLFLRCLRSPTFSVASSVQERSALNIVYVVRKQCTCAGELVGVNKGFEMRNYCCGTTRNWLCRVLATIQTVRERPKRGK